MIRVGIITASDKGSRGERIDQSGAVIREMVAAINGEIILYEIIPDEQDKICDALIRFVDEEKLDLIFTTGGTGLGPRDVTPDATLQVIDKVVPGIAEVMRMESLKKTNRAMLSRAVAGVRKKSLIINLPGSPKAVLECLEVILPALPHGIEILKGEAGECARK
ncbi:MAG: molybdopterin adenylyltransferase [Thermincolia bacterium]